MRQHLIKRRKGHLDDLDQARVAEDEAEGSEDRSDYLPGDQSSGGDGTREMPRVGEEVNERQCQNKDSDQ